MLLKKMMVGPKLHTVSVLSLTLCSLLDVICVFFTLTKTRAGNTCWCWIMVCGTGKKTEFSLSPESWGLETARPQLPLPPCQKQDALWGNGYLNMTASARTALGDAAVAWKGWFVKGFSFIETVFLRGDVMWWPLCLWQCCGLLV